MEGISINSVYQLAKERLNDDTFLLVPLFKIGNHNVLNCLYQDQTQIKVISPVGFLNGLRTFVFYQNHGNNNAILRQLILNIPEGSTTGYGRFESDVEDAVLVRIVDGEYQLIVFEGQRHFTLQLWQLLKDGQFHEAIADLVYQLKP